MNAENRIVRRKISLCIPYYDQPRMYAEQCRVLRGFPVWMRDGIELVMVDDGSPRCPLVPMECGVRAQYFRTMVDEAWNIPFTRNLSVKMARNEWLAFTDMDHLFPEEVMGELLCGEYDSGMCYTFERKHSMNGEVFHIHHNTYFFTKEVYEKIGADDERTAGLYATQETDFWMRAHQRVPCQHLNLVTVHYNRQVRDARVHGLPRDVREFDYRERRNFYQSQMVPGYAPRRVSFPWIKVGEFSE